MNDRERLIELVKDARDTELHFCSSCFDSDECLATGYCDKSLKVEADYLISHGVTVQKQGRWEQSEFDLAMDRVVCSHCKKEWNVIDNCTETFNYCPNCGAKMDKEVP